MNTLIKWSHLLKVQEIETEGREKAVEVSKEGFPIRIEVDSRAQITIIDEYNFRELGKRNQRIPQMSSTSKKIGVIPSPFEAIGKQCNNPKDQQRSKSDSLYLEDTYSTPLFNKLNKQHKS